MEQVVYADVLFIINFSMDFFSLYICARVLHRKMKTLALVLAASIGAVYSVTSLFLGSHLLFDIVIAFIVCAVAYESLFDGFSFSRVLCSTFFFFVCEMLMGGIFTALYNLFGKSVGDYSSAFDGSYFEGNDISLGIFFVIALFSTVLTYIGGVILGKGARKKQVNLEIVLMGKCKRLSALVDSGNLLREPISGKAVVIVSRKLMREIFPYEIEKNIEKLSGLCEKDVNIRFIPCNTVGKSVVLVGVIPDKIAIFNGRRHTNIDAVVAFGESNSDFDGCDALVPSALI